jgi:predicted phosphodiesterase
MQLLVREHLWQFGPMRVAAFSDIHGNVVALDAVVRDIEAQGGVDEYWVLGDLAALGPSPVQVLERLASLRNARIVRGNTDRYVYTGRDRPFPTMEQARDNPDLLVNLVECAATFSWSQGMLTPGGWIEWLERLPLEIEETLPDGTRVLAVHAEPGRDEGPGLKPGMGDQQLTEFAGDRDADLIMAGHTHRAVDQRFEGRRLINLGSVSNPYAPDLRASYVMLTADRGGYQIHHRRVEYDRDAVVRELLRVRHPAAAFIVASLRGERFQH